MNVTNTEGITPLDSAAASEYCSPAMISLLIKAGADPNFVPSLKDLPESAIKADWKRYASHKEESAPPEIAMVRRSPLDVAAAYDHPACARTLIKLGADVNAVMPGPLMLDRIPLMTAVDPGESAAVTALLLKAGASVKARNEYGRTALFDAVTSPPYCLHCAELLIAAGANVNAADYEGYTPLILAVGAKDSLPFVRILVESGANVNYRNPKTGMTALEAARAAGNSKVELPRKQGCDGPAGRCCREMT